MRAMSEHICHVLLGRSPRKILQSIVRRVTVEMPNHLAFLWRPCKGFKNEPMRPHIARLPAPRLPKGEDNSFVGVVDFWLVQVTAQNPGIDCLMAAMPDNIRSHPTKVGNFVIREPNHS